MLEALGPIRDDVLLSCEYGCSGRRLPFLRDSLSFKERNPRMLELQVKAGRKACAQRHYRSKACATGYK